MKNLIVLILFIFSVHSSSAVDPTVAREYAVRIEATVVETPTVPPATPIAPKLRLDWSADTVYYPATTYKVYRKTLSGTSWGPILQQGLLYSYMDTTVPVGGAFEYRVVKETSNGQKGYGYIYAGIEAAALEKRGKLILIVANTHAAALSLELYNLELDLIGDGWTVIRHDVSPTDTPEYVRGLIRTDYNGDPSNVKCVFLFGHVPVPYSGYYNVDGHTADHTGAYPADVFYGEMNGPIPWADATASTDDEFPAEEYTWYDWNRNIPGDGKFDYNVIPSDLELQVGRVDLSQMLTFAEQTPPRSEVDLLRQYLTKLHEYRHKVFTPLRRGLSMDIWGVPPAYKAYSSSAWRAFSAFFGEDNVTSVANNQFIANAASGSYLWAWVGSGGFEPRFMDDVGYSTLFAQNDIQTVFLMMLGSYVFDWDNVSNFYRAPLGSGDCLAAIWSGLPHWFMHHMAMGHPIGYSTRLSQNNGGATPLYQDHYNFQVNEPEFHRHIHPALMGDPSLRLHAVAPITQLTPTVAAGQVTLNWTASPDVNLKGYYIYRSTSAYGPFTRVHSHPIVGTTFTEPVPANGTYTYMVRAVKLEGGPGTTEKLTSGTYLNLSQGIIVTVTVSGTPTWTITEIGTLGGDYSSANAINVNTEITGYAQRNSYAFDGQVALGTFRWFNNYLYDMGYLFSPYEHNYGYGINDSGVIVGSVYNVDAEYPAVRYAYKKNVGMNMFVLPPLSGDSEADAAAINNNGYVVGSSVNSPYAVRRAVRWNQAGTLVSDLGSLVFADPSAVSYAFGINSAGKVVGTARTPGGVNHGFRTGALLTIDPLNDDLGTISGVTMHTSSAAGINDSDEIVGTSQNLLGQYRAFRKAPGTGMNAGFTDLGTLGGPTSGARAINNSGRVVGNSPTTTGGYGAFVHYPGWSAMQNLQNFISPMLQWDLYEANAINSEGKIVGSGYKNGIPRGFVMYPNQ